jgi:glutaminase
MPSFSPTRRDLARGLASLSLTAASFTPAAAKTTDRSGLSGAKIEAAVKTAYDKYRSLTEGKNAETPALAKVPSDYFGISVTTPGGEILTAGDIEPAFSIQSISKVCTLALVLQESGEQMIEDRIGVDATGRVYNSIEAIEAHRGKDMNPLVTPGAIATTGSVKGANADEIWAKILDIHSDFAGRPLTIDQEVYQSASSTNQRNRSIGMLMAAYDRFHGDPAQITDLYTRQCSISVTARDLGIIAATLANGGRNPVTGKQVVDSRHIPGILAVMATAGLYETTGQWLFRTGLPAKSGVGGGLIAIVPGKFGIASFSPPLDAAGNSVRGQKAITDISAALGGNPYAVASV